MNKVLNLILINEWVLKKRQEIYVENSSSQNVSKTGDYVTPGLGGIYKGQEVRD